jgi:restriction endonuclease Mrr
MSTKKISPAAIYCLKDALTNIFWYKKDLRGFLFDCLKDNTLLAKINWANYKINIVSDLIDILVKNEEKYQFEILELMMAITDLKEFPHLKRLDDGVNKEIKAKESVAALSKQVDNYKEFQKEKDEIEKKRKTFQNKILQISGVHDKLKSISEIFISLLSSKEPQKRGYKLETILKDLFELFDLDPKASFKIAGEQIDGAFSFEGTDYLIEAKWQEKPLSAADIDIFSQKLSRKLDNTLGIYISINGYTSDAVQTVSSGRRTVILMDGQDLTAVLENRIDLVQLLLRKRKTAAETGNIYLTINEILS